MFFSINFINIHSILLLTMNMNMNPRQMQAMMRKMGIAQEDLDAEEVIIRTKEFDIYIENPSVQKVKAMGQINYQVTGTEKIVPRGSGSAAAEITEEDIKTVMEQANCGKDEAKTALEKSNGDIAEAIVFLEDKE
jgi:nascent polypeptide-associated complex subunit alpha